MELRDALSQIAEIRQQMARGEIFRGYRSATTAFSGVVAVLGGIGQAVFIEDPQRQPLAFILLWICAAAISLLVVAAEMVLRTRRSHSLVQRQLTLLAVEQFTPSIVAGALMTWVFCDFLRSEVRLLPGLWMMLFSLGVFASSRLLPRAVFAVGGYYLMAGILALIAAEKGFAFSPWLMAGVFGVGQCATAVILYHRLEGRGAPMSDRTEGRYAYEGIDRVIHEKARLSIVASLASHSAGLLFGDLKDLCTLTDGNLSRHLAVLQEAGVVEVKKSFKNNRPQTWCKLTAVGRKRFAEYVGELERVVSDALKREKGRGAADISGGLLST